MKIFTPFLVAACLIPAAQGAEPVPARLIGYYSNMQAEGVDDPHFVSGYTIVLYRRKAETLGHVMVAIGSPEPARAAISKLAYDRKTMTLSFTAEYSAGVETDNVKTGPGREALRTLTFSGVVRPRSISGKVGVKDVYCGKCTPVFKNVTLRRIEEMGRRGQLQAFPE